MELYEVLEKRRTYRDFSDREVSDEILKRVIGATFKAPTNDHLRQLEFVVVRERENIAKVIAPLAKNMAAFEKLVAEVDESDDKDKMAMFADALPKQQKMLMESGLLIIPFFRQLTWPLLKPVEQSSLNYFASAWCALENMLLAAFYGGVAITSSGTTAVHALSYPLGGRHHIAHGVSNAMLLAPVMRFNLPACTDRLAQIHDAVFSNGSALSSHEKAEAVVSRLEEIVRALDIPSLSSFGISADELASLAQAGLDVRRLMVNNPRAMTLDEAIAIYKEAL